MEIICLKNEDGSEIDSEEEQSTFDIESLGNNLLPKYIRVPRTARMNWGSFVDY